jgi:NTP pyrophosphatase (non-canonical NTP hydrolase)
MNIQELQAKVIQFRDERDWAQYHNPKDLAISLSLEAAELLEVFQWKNAAQVETLKSDADIRDRVKEELGDIFIYALTMAHEFGLDPSEIVLQKLRVNEEKYPADKVKGRADKYTAY